MEWKKEVKRRYMVGASEGVATRAASFSEAISCYHLRPTRPDAFSQEIDNLVIHK